MALGEETMPGTAFSKASKGVREADFSISRLGITVVSTGTSAKWRSVRVPVITTSFNNKGSSYNKESG